MEKSIIATILLGIAMFSAQCQDNNKREFTMEMGDTTFTMKQYVFCMYLAGEERSQGEEESAEIQEQHMAHITMMAEKHNLLMAGPFGDDTEKRGILVFDLETPQDAERIIAQDPAVQAGRLKYECHPWWAAKGSSLK